LRFNIFPQYQAIFCKVEQVNSRQIRISKMKNIMTKSLLVLLIAFTFSLGSCGEKASKKEAAEVKIDSTVVAKYPSDVIPYFDKFRILLGDGTSVKELVNYEKKDFFYVENDGTTDWVVYKTPNSGVTSRTSSNTRTELGEIKHWIPEDGGKLTGALKVMHVSTSGDARVAASYSVVVGQIHSDEGHENEPLKIFYKKFPGHEKGSLYWNLMVSLWVKSFGMK